MNTNVIIALDTRTAKKDGTFPLVLRISHNRRTSPLYLDICLHEKDWNADKRIVRNSYSTIGDTAARLNNAIAKKKARAIALIEKLDAAHRLAAMTAPEVKDFIVKYIDRDDIEDPIAEEARPDQSFFVFADRMIAELETAKRLGSRDSYKSAAQAVENFHGCRDLTFEQMDYEFLMRFETAHYAKGNGVNGLAAYMRSIRAIYNKAIKAEIVPEKSYPFRKYTIRTAPTRKRAITAEALDKIIALQLAPDHVLFHARNYFIASYIMYGMNFADMAYLLKKDLIAGRVQCSRSKTGKLYDIKITSALQEIFDYYGRHHIGSPYLFPIIDRESAQGQANDVKWARKRYNKKLKELATECGIECNLTSYVSRHSFATHAVLNDVPLLGVSAMLTHSSVKTTQIYIQSLPTHMLDDYHDRIMQRQPKPEETAQTELQATAV